MSTSSTGTADQTIAKINWNIDLSASNHRSTHIRDNAAIALSPSHMQKHAKSRSAKSKSLTGPSTRNHIYKLGRSNLNYTGVHIRPLPGTYLRWLEVSGWLITFDRNGCSTMGSLELMKINQQLSSTRVTLPM